MGNLSPTYSPVADTPYCIVPIVRYQQGTVGQRGQPHRPTADFTLWLIGSESGTSELNFPIRQKSYARYPAESSSNRHVKIQRTTRGSARRLAKVVPRLKRLQELNPSTPAEKMVPVAAGQMIASAVELS